MSMNIKYQISNIKYQISNMMIFQYYTPIFLNKKTLNYFFFFLHLDYCCLLHLVYFIFLFVISCNNQFIYEIFGSSWLHFIIVPFFFSFVIFWILLLKIKIKKDSNKINLILKETKGKMRCKHMIFDQVHQKAVEKIVFILFFFFFERQRKSNKGLWEEKWGLAQVGGPI